MSDHNLKIVNASFEALNAHDLDKWSALQADSFMTETTAAPAPLNKAQARAMQQNFLTAFPDLRFDMKRTIVQDDHVVVHWTATGTNSGPMQTPSGKTVPATNKKGTVAGSSTLQIKDGKITRAWAFWDSASLMTQLGLMPAM